MDNTNIKKNEIGARIKTVRVDKGLTMEEFGKLFEPVIAKGTISNWEKGHYLPNNERLKKIADIGNVPMDYLLYGNLEMARNSIDHTEAIKLMMDIRSTSKKEQHNTVSDIFSENLNPILYRNVIALNEISDLSEEKLMDISIIIEDYYTCLSKDTSELTDKEITLLDFITNYSK